MSSTPEMLPFTTVDTMTTRPYTGNPTPTFLLDHLPAWPSEAALQKIANELNASETAFIRRVPSPTNSEPTYLVRWFTPYAEEYLCGHGLLAAAIVLHQSYDGARFSFITSRDVALEAVLAPSTAPNTLAFTLTFPSVPPTPSLAPPETFVQSFATALNLPREAIVGLTCNELMDVNIELDPSVDFSAASMKVDAVALMDASPEGTRSQVISSTWAKNGDYDFAKRVFAYGSEDQATGSTYCLLGPFYAAKLGKKELKVYQPSHRQGWAALEVDEKEVKCTVSGLVAVKGEVVHPDTC
ncbi:hypothetical protein MNV49_001245 [Pseudohyphozyma bogoriensis]|nr:hypothetical protein MNV49_001245 [Pseudohyphozyma bogoriensis]